MGLLDGLLGQLGVADQLAGLASKVGLSEDQVRTAMAALGQAHPQPGDTVATAAATTGLSADTLTNLVNQMGGENALSSISGMIDRDGDGNPLNDLAGIAGKLFG
ncbi:MAG: hypothetical protein AABZ45_07355 [Pseudomonadota bacterium]